MSAQNVPRVRENVGVLHRLLNFQENETKGQRITKALEGEGQSKAQKRDAER
jgi:hypothetical protein